MANNQFMQGRNEGISFALKIAKEKGIDALENECKFRNLTNMPSQVDKVAAERAIEEIKARVLDTVLIMSIAVLHDEFDFGSLYCSRFKERFNKKAECLADEYVTWADYTEMIEEELKIELTIGKK